MNKIISILMVLVLASGFALADETIVDEPIVEEPVVEETPAEEILEEELPIEEENHVHEEEVVVQEEEPVVEDDNCDVDGDGDEDLTDAVYVAELTRIDLDGDDAVDFHDAAILHDAIEGDYCHDLWGFLNEEEEPVEEPQPTTSGSGGGSVLTCLDGFKMVNRECVPVEQSEESTEKQFLTEDTAEEENNVLAEEPTTGVFNTITGAVTGAVVGTGKSVGFGETISYVASLLLVTLGIFGSYRLLQNSK